MEIRWSVYYINTPTRFGYQKVIFKDTYQM